MSGVLLAAIVGGRMTPNWFDHVLAIALIVVLPFEGKSDSISTAPGCFASAYTGIRPAEYAALFDTVSVSLWK